MPQATAYRKLLLEALVGGARDNLVQPVYSGPQIGCGDGRVATGDQLLKGIVYEHILVLCTSRAGVALG